MISVSVQSKAVAETRTDAISFTPTLVSGQALFSASGSISVYSGNDPSPASVLSSVSLGSGSSVNAKVQGGVVGTIYQIRIDCVTTNPAGTVSAAYYLAVVPDVL